MSYDRWFLGLGLIVALSLWPSIASSAEPCCSIVLTDEGRGLVTAQETATGHVFQFSVRNKTLFPYLKPGTVFYIRSTSPDNRFSLGLSATAGITPDPTESCCGLVGGSFVIGGGTASTTGSGPGVTAVSRPAAAAASRSDFTPRNGIAGRELAPGVRLVILELKRVSGNKLHLGFAIENRSSKTVDPQAWGIAASGKNGYSANGLMLLDLANGNRYFAGNSSVASNLQVAPADRREYWAQYQAPPAGVKSLTIQIPDAAPLYDVPVGK